MGEMGAELCKELPQTEVNLFAFLGPTEGEGPFPPLISWTTKEEGP